MSAPPAPRKVLLVGAERPLGAEIAQRLDEDGWSVATIALSADAVDRVQDLAAVVLVAPSRVGGHSFMTLPDTAFTERVCDLGDVFILLQQALPRLSPDGSVVMVTSRGFLGAWGGADEMAFSGALVALARSVGLENTPRGVRANVVAVDFGPQDFGGDQTAGSERASQVAAIVAFLIGPESGAIKGEVILANGGRSLQRREARNRRVELSS